MEVGSAYHGRGSDNCCGGGVQSEGGSDRLDEGYAEDIMGDIQCYHLVQMYPKIFSSNRIPLHQEISIIIGEEEGPSHYFVQMDDQHINVCIGRRQIPHKIIFFSPPNLHWEGAIIIEKED